MDVSYSAEHPDLDAPVLEAAAERPGEPIVVRVQPTIYRLRAGQRSGNQQVWTGVSWSARPKTVAEALALREALRLFFVAITKHSALDVATQLQTLIDRDGR
jgi:hypothetical protein